MCDSFRYFHDRRQQQRHEQRVYVGIGQLRCASQPLQPLLHERLSAMRKHRDFDGFDDGVKRRELAQCVVVRVRWNGMRWR